MRGFIFANVYIGILLVSIDASVPLQRVHQKLSHEPVHETFDTPEILPGHEAVPIDQSHISKRSVNQQSSLHMKPVDNDISKWIQPPDWALFTFNTPVYAIRDSPKGLQYIVYANATKTYGPQMVREYLSMYHNKRRKRQIDENKLEHLVDRLSIQNQINDVIGLNITSEGPSRTKRSYGDIVYPEILVIVDYDFFKMHGKNVYNIVKYLHGFWNGVDLEYRALESPKFRLNIAAIVIAETETALSYMSSSKLNSEYFLADEALKNSLSWLYENLSSIIDRKAYDVAVTMTPVAMCLKTANSELCQTGISGLTVYGSACQVDDDRRLVFKSAIVCDSGAFDGIRAAAHELAHTFGATHDGDSLNTQCPSTDGNIMGSITRWGTIPGSWSQCSLSAIENHLKTKGSCLYNQPKLDNIFFPYLPGKMMNANQQCKVLEGAQAYRNDETVCQALFCYTRSSGYTMSKARNFAPPGTRCNDGKICINHKCVSEPGIRSNL